MNINFAFGQYQMNRVISFPAELDDSSNSYNPEQNFSKAPLPHSRSEVFIQQVLQLELPISAPTATGDMPDSLFLPVVTTRCVFPQ